jgi:phage terminase small subunit
MDDKDKATTQTPDPILIKPTTKRGPGRPPKHGAYSKFTLDAITEEKKKLVYAIVKAEGRTVNMADEIYINQLARNLAQLEAYDRWFAEHGFLRDDSKGEPYPIVAQYQNLSKHVASMLEKLGMSPSGRHQISRTAPQKPDIATDILRAREEDPDE